MKEQNKIYILVFLLSLFSLQSTAQFQASAGLVYGSYAMDEVSSFQNEILNELPVPAKVMSDFPNFFGFEGKLYYHISRFSVGLHSSFHSTGSRINYTDYSGSFEYNQQAKITQIGIGCDYYLNPDQKNPWQIFTSLQIGYGWTKFNLNDKMVVGGFVLAQDNLDFVSNHITIHPGIGVQRTFGQFFGVVQAGYLLDSAEPLEYSEDRELNLLSDEREPIGVNWSGFRLSIGGGIKF